MAAKKKSHAKRKSVPRHTRKYQFRNQHPMDQHVEEVLNFWKSGKQEITNLRKAVALYYALEQGDLPTLFDMFPQYKTQFAPGTAEALEQFMHILKQQQPAAIGAGQIQSLTYDIPKPLPAPPVAQIKQASEVSADEIADNLLSMFL